MPKRSLVYTRAGDKGKTSLVGGQRVSKASLRLETYGTVDELNSFIGLLRADLGTRLDQDDLLSHIQHRLFTCGAYLATDNSDPAPNAYHAESGLRSDDVKMLEMMIDKLDENLPKLNEFVLPAGGPATAAAHICRVVSRRAERIIYRFIEEESVEMDPMVLQYINRLSDYFFVLGRATARMECGHEVTWNQKL